MFRRIETALLRQHPFAAAETGRNHQLCILDPNLTLGPLVPVSFASFLATETDPVRLPFSVYRTFTLFGSLHHCFV